MAEERSRPLYVTHAAVLLACAGLLAACSHAPQEPAPVFALPVSQVIGAPAIEGQEPAPLAAPSAARQLRYIAVPPDRKIAGMARAHLILKQTASAPHRHARKTKIAARHRGGVIASSKGKIHAAAAPQSSDAPPAMIMLDEPASEASAKPSPNR